MTQPDIEWSSEEKKIAKTALTNAYNREIEALIQHVKTVASRIVQPEDAWELHDFLSARRHDIDGKYDEREAFLMFTLSKLLKDGLLQRSELEGLASDKQAKITLLSRM